ncbi:MAG TPA: hypothetical protein VLA43_02385, partial [Longimicrobiales bacterium]|nr:hypothetical protein [Longimicrobiales bacterium]
MRRLATMGAAGMLAAALVAAPAEAQFTRVSVGLNFGLWDGVGIGFYGTSWDGPWSDGYLFSAGLGVGYVGSHGIYSDYGNGWTHWSHRSGYWPSSYYSYGYSSCWSDYWDPYWDAWSACYRPYRSVRVVSAPWWRYRSRVVTSVYWRDPFWDPWGPYYGGSTVYVGGGYGSWANTWYPRTRVVYGGRSIRDGYGGYATPAGYKAPARTAVASPRSGVNLRPAVTTRVSPNTRPAAGAAAAPTTRRATPAVGGRSAPTRATPSAGAARTTPTRTQGTARATPARTSPTAGAARSTPSRSTGAARTSPTAGSARSTPSRSTGAARTSPTAGAARSTPS